MSNTNKRYKRRTRSKQRTRDNKKLKKRNKKTRVKYVKRKKGGNLLGDAFNFGTDVLIQREIFKKTNPMIVNNLKKKLEECKKKNKILRKKYGIPETKEWDMKFTKNVKKTRKNKTGGSAEDLLVGVAEYKLAQSGIDNEKKFYRYLLAKCNYENNYIEKNGKLPKKQ